MYIKVFTKVSLIFVLRNDDFFKIKIDIKYVYFWEKYIYLLITKFCAKCM